MTTNEDNYLRAEVTKLAIESVEREKVIAKLEGEVAALRKMVEIALLPDEPNDALLKAAKKYKKEQQKDV